MANIYGCHFEYAGVSSRSYNLIIANVETERYRNLSGDISSVTIFNRNHKKRYLVGTDYSESALSFDVDIVTDNDECIGQLERREIERWLFNKHSYNKFYVDMSDDIDGETYEIVNGLQRRLYLNCRFINPEKLEYNGGIVGYRVTLEADSNLWWQDGIKLTCPVRSNAGNIITIDVDSDIDDYTYPVIAIYPNGNSTFTIVNTTDDPNRETVLTNLSSGRRYYINCELNQVLEAEISTNFVTSYDKLLRQNFPRLVNGRNILTFQSSGDNYQGDSIIEVVFQNRRRF